MEFDDFELDISWKCELKTLLPTVHLERCEATADAALPVFLYLRRMAADGEVVYSDDTRVKILSCLKEKKGLKKRSAEERKRAGSW